MISHHNDDTSRVSSCSSFPDSGYLRQSWSYGNDVIAAYNGCVFDWWTLAVVDVTWLVSHVLEYEVHVLIVPCEYAEIVLAAFQPNPDLVAN
jgi:hypothetical protein